MAVLAFFPFIGIVIGKLILPLLPFLESGLDRQETLIFHLETFPFRRGIDLLGLPGLFPVQLPVVVMTG